jgi:hypothetical protein
MTAPGRYCLVHSKQNYQAGDVHAAVHGPVQAVWPHADLRLPRAPCPWTAGMSLGLPVPSPSVALSSQPSVIEVKTWPRRGMRRTDGLTEKNPESSHSVSTVSTPTRRSNSPAWTPGAMAPACHPRHSEAETRRIAVQSQPGEIVHEAPSQKNPKPKKNSSVEPRVQIPVSPKGKKGQGPSPRGKS